MGNMVGGNVVREGLAVGIIVVNSHVSDGSNDGCGVGINVGREVVRCGRYCGS